MVAAFAKKIARLSLSAPPNGKSLLFITKDNMSGHFLGRSLLYSCPCCPGVAVGVVCVSNLIKRHPNCRVLLHRKEGEQTNTDRFNLSEPNPAKCGALESSLWELKVHTHTLYVYRKTYQILPGIHL